MIPDKLKALGENQGLYLYMEIAGQARDEVSETLYQVIQIANHFVEQLVHQLWLHHLGDVSYDAFAGAGNPSGLGVGTAAAGEDEDASIGLLKGLKVGGELAFGEGKI